jgi:hypothetical protein
VSRFWGSPDFENKGDNNDAKNEKKAISIGGGVMCWCH